MLTSIEDVVGQWKEYFKDLLNLTGMPSVVEAESGDKGDDSCITKCEVTQVVNTSVNTSVVAGPMVWMRFTFIQSSRRLWMM